MCAVANIGMRRICGSVSSAEALGCTPKGLAAGERRAPAATGKDSIWKVKRNASPSQSEQWLVSNLAVYQDLNALSLDLRCKQTSDHSICGRSMPHHLVQRNVLRMIVKRST